MNASPPVRDAFDPQVDAPARGNLRHAAIGLITLTMFTGTAARYAISPMQELVRVDLGLGDHQIALLQGMAIALPTALMSIPLGRLVDRANRARLLIVLALVCAAGSVLTAFAHDFATAFIARMMVCAAVVAAQPTALSLGADLTPASQRGRMIMVTSLGQALGGAIAFVLAGRLLAWLPSLLPAGSGLEEATGLTALTALTGLTGLTRLAPWRLVQLAFAAAVLVAAAALLLMREPPRRELGAAPGSDLRAALHGLWGYRAFLLPLVVGMVTVAMADAAAAIWAVPVLTRNFHQTPADFGTWMGALNLGANVVGAVLGGVAADLGQRLGSRGGVMLGAVLGAALSVPAALFPIMPEVTGFAVLMGLLLAAGACVNIAATSAMMVILPNELRGICFSLLVAVIGLAAFGVAPLLVSFAAQTFGHPSDVALPLICVGVFTSLCGLGAFIQAMRIARRPAASA